MISVPSRNETNSMVKIVKGQGYVADVPYSGRPKAVCTDMKTMKGA